MRQEINRLPVALAGLPSISQRLNMSEQTILSRAKTDENSSTTNIVGPIVLPTNATNNGNSRINYDEVFLEERDEKID